MNHGPPITDYRLPTTDHGPQWPPPRTSIEFRVTDYFKTMKLGDAECGGSTQYGRNLLLPPEKHDNNKLIGKAIRWLGGI